MTFLAPWALLGGVMAAAALVALHLVARQRPAAYPLPTARFVPDRRSLVSRAAQRPRDLLLLLLRVLLVLSAAAAFARPVRVPPRRGKARLLLLDRSAAVADAARAARRAREIASDGVPTQLVLFDSGATASGMQAAIALDSLAADTARLATVPGSLSATFAAARRVGAELGLRADSVELVLVSALSAREWDAATDSLRALWPGSIRVERAVAVADTVSDPALERAMEVAEPLGPALTARAVHASAHSVRIMRRRAGAPDSAFARGGGIVVRWDSLPPGPALPTALVMGNDVVVAPLTAGSLAPAGLVLARWADGSPAAIERPLGAGCMREVAVGVPAAGDLPLRPAFRRIVNRLTGWCAGEEGAGGAVLDSARIARIAGGTRPALGSALADRAERASPFTPWLLGLALACALAELPFRRGRVEREAA